MKYSLLLLAFLFASSAFGASSKSEQPESTEDVFSKKLMEIKQMNKVENTMEGAINSLAKQLLVSSNATMLQTPIAVTSFVQLDKLKKTSEFGRILSESLMSELGFNGLNVIEYRGQNALSVSENGEFFITRDTTQMKQEIQNTNILVGTLSRLMDRVVINARIMEASGKIISSARVIYYPKTSLDCKMFDDCNPIKIVPAK